MRFFAFSKSHSLDWGESSRLAMEGYQLFSCFTFQFEMCGKFTRPKPHTFDNPPSPPLPTRWNIAKNPLRPPIGNQFNIMADHKPKPRHGLVKGVKINPLCVQLHAN